jgi:CheY-like chemotaxis protein
VRLQALADKEEQNPGNDFLRFEISSDAVHPGEHNAEEIFQPFRRNDGELDAGPQSSGLSLAIARKLVEMMSGTITAGFTANNGCRFEILIPHRREPGKMPASPSNKPPQSARTSDRKPMRASVLIIDDEGSSRKVHRSLMEFLGFGCHEAAGVEELKSRLSEQHYELILLDLMMPGMDGFEIARRLRDGEFGESNRQAFIVAVTSCMEESIHERIRAAGMNEYISKPLTTQELRRALRSFREHRDRAFASNAG